MQQEVKSTGPIAASIDFLRGHSWLQDEDAIGHRNDLIRRIDARLAYYDPATGLTEFETLQYRAMNNMLTTMRQKLLDIPRFSDRLQGIN